MSSTALLLMIQPRFFPLFLSSTITPLFGFFLYFSGFSCGFSATSTQLDLSYTPLCFFLFDLCGFCGLEGRVGLGSGGACFVYRLLAWLIDLLCLVAGLNYSGAVS
ncbi:uncharacterized protein BO72DRAFT_249279 [Aspergillus fijiensis CBS 313.89]|uniref:Transmembrane protein n=1 Tax=Aspergillus fijiensis CBS 313.89 TaxID=1448319 RepID=A0A8G1RGU5_9EURO|nr:uncharacterized protein BO72DRAFT_249279 [Aspergillus fijiensis CBS 313.89]RAK73070.1 hypothetical protein BO72DRAFT_249279 [Aspergillus fijiensis CBS 313.89]